MVEPYALQAFAAVSMVGVAAQTPTAVKVAKAHARQHQPSQAMEGTLAPSFLSLSLKRCLSTETMRKISAASTFPDFAAVGDTEKRKREIVAFLAQTAHATTGGWDDAPDGTYAWGYCFVRQTGEPGGFCVPNGQWPCVPGRSYYGRGPIQLSYNYNYGPAGEALGYDLLSNPDLVATDPVISFKAAFWFWMTPQSPKPSCHDVITGAWTPSTSDIDAGRVPGYGVITNIINGGLECGHGPDDRVANRIGFYEHFCDLMGLNYGNDLDCYNQRPFGNGMEYYSSMK